MKWVRGNIHCYGIPLDYNMFNGSSKRKRWWCTWLL